MERLKVVVGIAIGVWWGLGCYQRRVPPEEAVRPTGIMAEERFQGEGGPSGSVRARTAGRRPDLWMVQVATVLRTCVEHGKDFDPDGTVYEFLLASLGEDFIRDWPKVESQRGLEIADTWGRPMQFRRRRDVIYLLSLGQDGKEDTSVVTDDIEEPVARQVPHIQPH